MSNCEVVTFSLVSWVRCGAWLNRFLIFAIFLTSMWTLIWQWIKRHIGCGTMVTIRPSRHRLDNKYIVVMMTLYHLLVEIKWEFKSKGFPSRSDIISTNSCNEYQMSHHMIWYFSHRRIAKAQTSLAPVQYLTTRWALDVRIHGMGKIWTRLNISMPASSPTR